MKSCQYFYFIKILIKSSASDLQGHLQIEKWLLIFCWTHGRHQPRLFCFGFQKLVKSPPSTVALLDCRSPSDESNALGSSSHLRSLPHKVTFWVNMVLEIFLQGREARLLSLSNHTALWWSPPKLSYLMTLYWILCDIQQLSKYSLKYSYQN